MQLDHASVQSAVGLARKMQVIFWKSGKSTAPVTQNDFRHFFTPAKLCYTMFQTSKSDTFCSKRHRYGQGPFTADSGGRLRTGAKGCEWLRTAKQPLKRPVSTPSPSIKWEPFATHLGKKLWNNEPAAACSQWAKDVTSSYACSFCLTTWSGSCTKAKKPEMDKTPLGSHFRLKYLPCFIVFQCCQALRKHPEAGEKFV